MTSIVGIDFSSFFIDLVVIDENDERPPAWHRRELVGADAFTRTRHVRRVLQGYDWDDTLAVGIEHPAGTHGSQVLMRVQGAILASLPSRLLVQDWPPGKWRKAVGLPGNASKQHIAAWVIAENGSTAYASWPQDACDAFCIALATKNAIYREEVAA